MGARHLPCKFRPVNCRGYMSQQYQKANVDEREGFLDTAQNEPSNARLPEIVPKPVRAAKKRGSCAGGPFVETMVVRGCASWRPAT